MPAMGGIKSAMAAAKKSGSTTPASYNARSMAPGIRAPVTKVFPIGRNISPIPSHRSMPARSATAPSARMPIPEAMVTKATIHSRTPSRAGSSGRIMP